MQPVALLFFFFPTETTMKISMKCLNLFRNLNKVNTGETILSCCFSQQMDMQCWETSTTWSTFYWRIMLCTINDNLFGKSIQVLKQLIHEKEKDDFHPPPPPKKYMFGIFLHYQEWQLSTLCAAYHEKLLNKMLNQQEECPTLMWHYNFCCIALIVVNHE